MSRDHLLLIVLVLLTAPIHAATESKMRLGWQTLSFGDAAASYRFPVYSNLPLTADTSRVRIALIIQHGLIRDGDAYFAIARELLDSTGLEERETLLIAPQFLARQDAARMDTSGFPIWSTEGWTGGDDSISGVPQVSSLQVYDDLLKWLSDRKRFPALTHIVIAGHSGGAQLVQRYAALNNMDEKLRAAGISIRYVIANPSSYLYFTNERPQGERFAPYDTAACPNFNTYKYGFEHVTRYAANVTPENAFNAYAGREVVYMLGTADTNPNHRVLDKSCPAQAQGRYRLERGRAYISYERYLAGDRVKLNHRAYEVIGVAHDAAKMFRSACGPEILLGVSGSKSADAALCVERR